MQPLEIRVRPWYNPDLKSSTFIVPGIIGVLLAMMLILITSMAIVRERERGTLEQLVVTPISKTSLMLGKIVPFIVVGYVQMTVILVLGKVLFDIPIRGSLPLLYVLTLAYIVANLALGHARVDGDEDAGAGDAAQLLPDHAEHPALGLHVPARRDAGAGAVDRRGAAADVLPRDSARRAAQGRSGSRELWRETLALCAFAVGLILLSVRRFRKTIG